MEEPVSESDIEVAVGDDDNEIEGEEVPKTADVEASLEAKLKELLHRINSIEIKLYSDAMREFMTLLEGDTGGKLLHLYVQTSPKLLELLETWKLKEGKPGISYVLSLISAILSHPYGKYAFNERVRIGVSKVLDKFVRFLIDEKLNDIYKELNSKEWKRQSAALLLMASIVRRGSGLASEVAKKFDFNLQGFSKLAEYKQRQSNKKMHLTRKPFVGFAMSFLEVGKPRLLRWILQQRQMYYCVLRGLGNDEDETIIYVLTTLCNRVLTEKSLVPPGLRSVLFGSVTLEQLVNISGRDNGGYAAELAYGLLLMVCTDPCHGLMPDFEKGRNSLRGNAKRLLGVMKKLKATEVHYHRDLLLAIVRGRPSLAAAYLVEFPYNLEDHASPTWFSAVSLATNLVSSVGMGHPFGFLDAKFHDPPSFHSANVQSVINCICPRPFSRSVINKGLLHSDFLVKHGTLRLLLEVLKFLNSFLNFLSQKTSSGNQMMQSWAPLKQEIQNEVRTLLPDAQVLLTLLSALGSHTRSRGSSSKRKPDLECNSKDLKKLKKDTANEDIDIVVSGISSASDIALQGGCGMFADTHMKDELVVEKEFLTAISDIWGLDLCFTTITTLKDAEMYFYLKLIDGLKIYLQAMPTVLDGCFDFFMNLLSNPLALSTDLQCSLLSLLIEYIEWSPGNVVSIKAPAAMYKYLQPFINLVILSPNDDIKDRAHNLARVAMLSTGAFDINPYEAGAWFLFLPGYSREKESSKFQEIEVMQSLAPVVISFLCDAVSAIGNNLFKYWDIVRQSISSLKGFKGVSPDFSPLIICVLDKCLRLLSSQSGTFSLSEKSMISLYVCNTLKFLLQTQVDARLLSAVVESVLLEGLGDRFPAIYDSGDSLCEWRPLKNLLFVSQSVLQQQTWCLLSVGENGIPADSSFTKTVQDSSFSSTLDEVKKLLRRQPSGEIIGIAKAFYSAMLCTTPDVILKSFPPVITISQNLGVVSLLSSMAFIEPKFIYILANLWPEVFFPGLEMALSLINNEGKEDNEHAALDHDFGAIESAVGSYSLFLKQTPFHILFPAIIRVDKLRSLEASKTKELLLAKLSDWTSDSFISYLRLVLFWFYQVRSLYRIKPSPELEQASDICLTLVKHMFSELSALKTDIDCSLNAGFPLSVETIQKVGETIFCHPAATSILVSPLSYDGELPIEILGGSLENFLSLARQRLHNLDNHVLDMLTAFLDYLLSPSSGLYLLLECGTDKAFVKAFSALVQTILLELRDKFDACINGEGLPPLLPVLCTLHALIQFISPFELLGLADWMFCRVHELTAQNSSMISALSVGFSITAGAFENLSTYMQQPIRKKTLYDLLWETEDKTFDAKLIEGIYVRLCKFACDFKLKFADICLLKAVNVMYRKNNVQPSQIHLSSMLMSRVIDSTPLKMVSCCIYKTSMTKARLLVLLIEISPLLLSFFGQIFLRTLNDGSKETLTEDISGSSLSDEDFMMLLPAALSYINAASVKFGKQYYTHITSILSLYTRMLLNGFQHWKVFVSGDMFQEEYDEFFPSSAEELLSLVEGSLLGKAIQMLRCYFSLSEESFKMKKRLKLFNSILQSSVAHEELLDCDVNEMNFNSLKKSLNLINKVVAKISFCMMLLFPEDIQIQSSSKEADGGLKEVSSKTRSDNRDSSRMRFINILVSTWQWMVNKFPLVPGNSKCIVGKSENCLWLYKCLEDYILRTVLELITKMQSYLIELQSIPFLEQLMRFALLYRFEDPKTLRMLRSILALLSDGKVSYAQRYLQLLLAHSQFVPLIRSISKLSSSEAGSFFRPMSGILRSLVVGPVTSNSDDGENDQEAAEMKLKQMETIKLLRTLLQSTFHHSGSYSKNDIDINLSELHFLLLFSYGATLAEIDLEMYNLIHGIRFVNKSETENIAEIDYLWGNAALEVKRESAVEQGASNNIMTDTEASEERRRSQFRENLSIDPKICAATVLYFPYDRIASDEPLFYKLQTDNLANISERHSPDAGNIQRYDPVFILRFSIHTLTTGYLEPIEFAGLGLLAVAFVSIASPDLGIRKLGYETLARFKNALEKSQKKKDVMQLRLLLMCMQNGIQEPWQKIPSIISLFAAESSLILLNPLHDHYAALTKFLTRSSRVNMKQIPLFSDFFQSVSVNFKAERLWILRLAYVGLNLDDDAQIYIKNSILEILMSFYASPLSDDESKELILEIVKRSVKLHDMARYLIEHCSLFSWLSSILSIYSEVLLGDERKFSTKQLAVVIKIVNDVISSRNIANWLQRYALEQLMEFSSSLSKLLLGSMKLTNQNVDLVSSTLEIMISTMRLSQNREMYQPHFTLSIEGLFQIYQVIKVDGTARGGVKAEHGLKTILMSLPPVDLFRMDQEMLLSFLMWAVSTALKSESGEVFQGKESYFHLNSMPEEVDRGESLISKLLRWLTASVIRGKLFNSLEDFNAIFPKGSNPRTLESLLEHVIKRYDEINKSRFQCDEILATTIYYIQQCLGRNCRVLPSVVSALCVLLLCLDSNFRDLLLDHGTSTVSVCSRIRCPSEASPAWRWSFDETWKDPSAELTDLQKMDELHACQTLIVMISNVLGKKSLDFHVWRDVHAANSVFKWERSIIEAQ